MINDNQNSQIVEVKDSDPGSNAYVITYLTMKHGDTKSEISFDYGKDLNVSYNDLTKGSFNGIGDNLMWGEVIWRFTINNVLCVLRTRINSLTRTAGTSQLVLPKEPIKLPGNKVLSPEDLKGFNSYPFNDVGSIRDAKELARDSNGEIAFIDVSNNEGQDSKTEGLINHIRSSGNVKNVMNADGPEFVSFKNLRYAGPDKRLMRPDGQADMVSTQKVQEILSKGPQQNSEKVDSIFKPKSEPSENTVKTEKQQRFAEDRDTETTSTTETVDTDGSTKGVKTLNKELEKTKNLLRDTGLFKRASIKNIIVQNYLNNI